MLLYASSRFTAVMFAVAVAIGSKTLFRVSIHGASRHFFNPSNFGITITLLLFPWVGIAPPYQFTERVSGVADWAIPAVILASGLLLNIRLTLKGPLIAGWLGGFVVQAVVRSAAFGTPVVAALGPATGVAFILFTNYMITDPGTTPVRASRQVLFGLATAATYGLLVANHVVFGLFFALTIVCGLRGLAIAVANAVGALSQATVPATTSVSTPAALQTLEPASARSAAQ
jgi:enediyne biosynthesis protein E5